MLRRIVVVAILIGLSACGAMRSPFALIGKHAHRQTGAAPVEVAATPPPKPAEGLWAILDPGCAKPSGPNIHKWPTCASPFWISRDKALMIRSDAHASHAPRDASIAADFTFSPGEPLIAQVGTEKDGYLFLALTDLAEDDQGRLVGAVGAAVSCPKPRLGSLVLKPMLNGCDAASIDTVRQAAIETLQDRVALSQVAWIAPGAP